MFTGELRVGIICQLEMFYECWLEERSSMTLQNIEYHIKWSLCVSNKVSNKVLIEFGET